MKSRKSALDQKAGSTKGVARVRISAAECRLAFTEALLRIFMEKTGATPAEIEIVEHRKDNQIVVSIRKRKSTSELRSTSEDATPED